MKLCSSSGLLDKDRHTVYGAASRVGLGEVIDAFDKLRAVTLAEVFDGLDLGFCWRRVCPEYGIAEVPAVGVTAHKTTAC